jgi:hypothetical protein
MSLTSYRAAPPRATIGKALASKEKRRREIVLDSGFFNIMNGLRPARRQQSLATTYSSIA